MNFYKVLIRDSNGILESASRTIDDRYRIKYREGEDVFPIEGTKLFIFNKLNSAKDFYKSFLDDGNNVELWRCVPTNPVKAPEIGSSWTMEAYWKYYNDGGIHFGEYSSIYGKYGTLYKMDTQYPDTYFCESLRVVERKL